MILLRSRPGDAHLLRLTPGRVTVENQGVVDLSGLVGSPPGTAVAWGSRRYRAFRPSLDDLLGHLSRKAQIILPKDAQQLLRLGGVGPGGHVAEAGAGSGALSLVLAHAVGASGHVLTYDRRPDFLEVTRRNLERSGLADRVELRLRDVVAEGFDATGLDGLLLDLPEPWGALPHARTALIPGASVGIFTPTYNQLERTVRELRDLGFEEVRSFEFLERALHVGEGGTRPEFDMLGHTGFLTGARWMGGPW